VAIGPQGLIESAQSDGAFSTDLAVILKEARSSEKKAEALNL
jgi:hypothetical protein